MDDTPLHSTSGVRCPSNFVDFKAKRQENYSSGRARRNFILLVTKFHLIVVRLHALKGDVDILAPKKGGLNVGVHHRCCPIHYLTNIFKLSFYLRMK